MLAFLIPGVPKATQTGSIVRVNGRAFPVRRHSEWSAYCRLVAKQHAPDVPLDGPLRCSLTFHLPRLSSGRRAFPNKRPDLDNLAKGVTDSFNGILWMDDAQIVELRLSKLYETTGQPGLYVCVERL